MPPALLFDPQQISHCGLLATRDEIYRLLPHRHEFMQLHGVTYADDKGQAAAYRDVTGDEFWVKGHIPGRPIFPGVLMIETAAQLVSYATARIMRQPDQFLGLGGVDKVKFRGAVVPDCRIILLCKLLEARSRRWVWACQALVEDRLVFEGEITGMLV